MVTDRCPCGESRASRWEAPGKSKVDSSRGQRGGRERVHSVAQCTAAYTGPRPASARVSTNHKECGLRAWQGVTATVTPLLHLLQPDDPFVTCLVTPHVYTCNTFSLHHEQIPTACVETVTSASAPRGQHSRRKREWGRNDGFATGRGSAGSVEFSPDDSAARKIKNPAALRSSDLSAKRCRLVDSHGERSPRKSAQC